MKGWPNGAPKPNPGDVLLGCTHVTFDGSMGLHVFMLQEQDLGFFINPTTGERVKVRFLCMCSDCDAQHHDNPLGCPMTTHGVYSPPKKDSN